MVLSMNSGYPLLPWAMELCQDYLVYQRALEAERERQSAWKSGSVTGPFFVNAPVMKQRGSMMINPFCRVEHGGFMLMGHGVARY